MAVTPIFEGDLACTYLSRDAEAGVAGRDGPDGLPHARRLGHPVGPIPADRRRCPQKRRRPESRPRSSTRHTRRRWTPARSLAWPDGPTSGRESVLQYAMDLYYRSRQAFYAEYQCKPLSTTVAPGLMLSADQIARKTSGTARRHGPARRRILDGLRRRRQVATCGTPSPPGPRISPASVIEYGAWPEQRRRYYTKGDANPTIASLFCQGTARPGRRERSHHAGRRPRYVLAATCSPRPGRMPTAKQFALKRLLCDTGDLGDVVMRRDPPPGATQGKAAGRHAVLRRGYRSHPQAVARLRTEARRRLRLALARPGAEGPQAASRSADRHQPF